MFFPFRGPFSHSCFFILKFQNKWSAFWRVNVTRASAQTSLGGWRVVWVHPRLMRFKWCPAPTSGAFLGHIYFLTQTPAFKPFVFSAPKQNCRISVHSGAKAAITHCYIFLIVLKLSKCLQWLSKHARFIWGSGHETHWNLSDKWIRWIANTQRLKEWNAGCSVLLNMIDFVTQK